MRSLDPQPLHGLEPQRAWWLQDELQDEFRYWHYLVWTELSGGIDILTEQVWYCPVNHLLRYTIGSDTWWTWKSKLK